MLALSVLGLATAVAGLGSLVRSIRVTARTARHAADLF